MWLKLSPTKVGSWQGCPRKYFYSYVARERAGRAWAHLSYGNAVHAALRSWFELPAEHREVDAIPGLIDGAWSNAGFKDGEQATLWRERAAAIIRDYLDGIDPHFEPMSTERSLAFKTDAFIMEGRIDRLDESGGEVAVVDYKTGRRAPDAGEVRGSSALAMYALMVQRCLGRPAFEVSLHHIPSGVQSSWRHSPESLLRHEQRIGQIAADISLAQDTWEAADRNPEIIDELFPATPGPLCGFCDFWGRCAVGQATTQRKESWAGLGEDEG